MELFTEGAKGSSDAVEYQPPPKEEEKVDIDTSDPAVEEAAVKIQAAFRGHKSRQEINETAATTESTEPESKTDESVQKVDETPKDTESSSAVPETSGTEPTEPAAAAAEADESNKTEADATEVVTEDVSAEATVTDATSTEAPGADEAEKETDTNEFDMDLNDPEKEAAAIRIQASFRGHKSRQELKASKSSKSAAEVSDIDGVIESTSTNVVVTETEVETTVETSTVETVTEVSQPENEDELAEQEKAAIRIQSSFRGHKVRKEIKASRSNEEVAGDEANTVEPETEIENVVNVAGEDLESTAEAGVDEDAQVDTQDDTAAINADEGKAELENSGEEQQSEDDPEAIKAATKIQASFRGHQVRKNMKAKIDVDEQANAEGEQANNMEDEI